MILRDANSPTSEQIEARRAAQRRYDASPKGRATKRKYDAVPERKAARREYNASPEAKARSKARHEKRTAMAVEYLGGVCVECGTTENLEFHHIIAASKSFNISSNVTRAWDKLCTELDLCELLCAPCHKTKTSAERTSVID